MNNLSKPDFSGQHIYVGMDVHKKSWSISIVTEHSAHKTFSQPPDPAVLSSYMQRNFPTTSSVIHIEFCHEGSKDFSDTTYFFVALKGSATTPSSVVYGQ